ncbi:hypothetical protein CPC08DRAFT_769901 [Agrocybe pediades]|nr:hypothetical protein CPC08DRAFT_769901 [Agrocybe pediades]
MAKGYEVVPGTSSRRKATVTEVTWISHAGQTRAKPVRKKKQKKTPGITIVPNVNKDQNQFPAHIEGLSIEDALRNLDEYNEPSRATKACILFIANILIQKLNKA